MLDITDAIKRVIIVGAGGSLGPFLLQALDQDPQFTVSVLSRKGSSSKFPPHIKVYQIDADYPEDQLLTSFSNKDAVVLLLPPAAVEPQKKVIDALVKTNVKRLIPSEFGYNTADQDLVDLHPAFRHKQEVAQYLQSKESSISWTGIINGVFFDLGIESGMLGFDIKSHTAILYDQGKHLITGTIRSTIGLAVVSILKNPSIAPNQYVYINSYRLSQHAILSSLEKISGGQKWSVTYSSIAQLRRTSLEKIGQGDRRGEFGLMQAFILGGAKAADYPATGRLMNEELGLPEPEDLDLVLKKIVQKAGGGSVKLRSGCWFGIYQKFRFMLKESWGLV